MKDTVAKLYASGIDFCPSPLLQKRLKLLLGKDPFGPEKEEANGDKSVVQVEDVVDCGG